jgi:hypothetical protein
MGMIMRHRDEIARGYSKGVIEIRRGSRCTWDIRE